MKILLATNPKELEKLRTVSQPVQWAPKTNDPVVISLCDGLASFVLGRNNNAVGLAAVQVGVPLRIFALYVRKQNGYRDGVRVMVNPEVRNKSTLFEEREETCLSEPGVCVKVKRPTSVMVAYRDWLGRPTSMYLSGINARIFFHELDHLDGRLLIDYMEVQQ